MISGPLSIVEQQLHSYIQMHNLETGGYLTNLWLLPVHAFFLQKQFYKNNEAQIWPKIKKKLRTMEARLQIQM